MADEIRGIYENVAYCGNCNMLRSEHVGTEEKCLFDTTTFTPRRDMFEMKTYSMESAPADPAVEMSKKEQSKFYLEQFKERMRRKR